MEFSPRPYIYKARLHPLSFKGGIRLGNYFAPARRHWKDGKLYFTPESAFRRLSLRGRSPSHIGAYMGFAIECLRTRRKGLDGKWKAIANLEWRAEFWLNHLPPRWETLKVFQVFHFNFFLASLQSVASEREYYYFIALAFYGFMHELIESCGVKNLSCYDFYLQYSANKIGYLMWILLMW